MFPSRIVQSIANFTVKSIFLPTGVWFPTGSVHRYGAVFDDTKGERLWSIFFPLQLCVVAMVVAPNYDDDFKESGDSGATQALFYVIASLFFLSAAAVGTLNPFRWGAVNFFVAGVMLLLSAMAVAAALLCSKSTSAFAVATAMAMWLYFWALLIIVLVVPVALCSFAFDEKIKDDIVRWLDECKPLWLDRAVAPYGKISRSLHSRFILPSSLDDYDTATLASAGKGRENNKFEEEENDPEIAALAAILFPTSSSSCSSLDDCGNPVRRHGKRHKTRKRKLRRKDDSNSITPEMLNVL